MSERKPLTLEQLLRMDGKPVFCISLKDGRKKWRVVQSIEKFVDVVKVICFTDCKDETVASYGKTWIAYAYEPLYIDRSVWEPCEHCKPSKNPLDRWGPHQFPIDGNQIYCYDTDDGWEGEEINFCPWCGRPLTDAVWDMLEKRLEKIT